jgi:hypothetical protein
VALGAGERDHERAQDQRLQCEQQQVAGPSQAARVGRRTPRDALPHQQARHLADRERRAPEMQDQERDEEQQGCQPPRPRQAHVTSRQP